MLSTPLLIFLGVLVLVGLGIIFGVNPDIEPLVPTMVMVSGEVATVGFSTDPFKLEFTEKSSDQPKTVILDDNNQYSTSLASGTYDVKIFYTTFGDLTALDCDAGTHDIDSDIDNFTLKC